MGVDTADYRGGVTCLYDTQLLGDCLHVSECGGRYRPEAVRGMPAVPIAPQPRGREEFPIRRDQSNCGESPEGIGSEVAFFVLLDETRELKQWSSTSGRR